MIDFVSVLAEEGHHAVNELPMPPFMFGVIAFVAFLVLATITWTFRNVSEKSPVVSRVMPPEGALGHGGAAQGAIDGAHSAPGHR